MEQIPVLITRNKCDYGNYKEIKVAFGDFSNCQINCPFCFTKGQRQSDNVLSALLEQNFSNISILRFTGGEPLYTQQQINGMAEIINEIDRRVQHNLDIIVIQTNALSVDDMDVDGLYQTKLPLLFEVSLKGTNSMEYRYLTSQEPIEYAKAIPIMQKQFHGYRKIAEKCHSLGNIKVLARLGIFHSGMTRPKYRFIFPETRKIMFHPSYWCTEFNGILQDQNGTWNDVFERKFVVEKIRPSTYGTQNMSNRYRRIISLLEAKGLVEKRKTELPNIYKQKYYSNLSIHIYKKAAVLLKI